MDGETIDATKGLVEAITELFVKGGFSPWTIFPFFVVGCITMRTGTILQHRRESRAADRQFKLDGDKLGAKLIAQRQKRERKNARGSGND